MSIFWSQEGRDPGRDPLVLWWDPGPLVLWWDPGPGPGPLSVVVGPGTRAGPLLGILVTFLVPLVSGALGSQYRGCF